MTLHSDASRALYERATAVTPGGVNSPVRAMRSVERDWPPFIVRGNGAYIVDADGNEFVDWVQSWGALPLGHADAAVVEAVERALRDGASFGAATVREVELAERVVAAIPGADMVRFMSSGTEATMTALRLARGTTGRDRVVMFEGCYHGHSDAFLAAAGSGLATLGIPSSPGVPADVAAHTVVAPYGDIDALRALVDEAGGDTIAAIFVEPVACNMGVVWAGRDWLQALRTLCDEIGALLIFDEVITGFRLARGGAQERYGITADLATFGKVIGGGLPVGALAGRADIMNNLAPAGTVYQAGTLSGNPLAMAAGIATLEALDERGAYARLDELGGLLATALERELGTRSDVVVTREGPLVTLFHTESGASAPQNFADVKRCSTERFAHTHAAALEAGHWLPPSQFEGWFVSLAHKKDHVASLAEAVAAGVRTFGASPVGAR